MIHTFFTCADHELPDLIGVEFLPARFALIDIGKVIVFHFIGSDRPLLGQPGFVERKRLRRGQWIVSKQGKDLVDAVNKDMARGVALRQEHLLLGDPVQNVVGCLNCGSLLVGSEDCQGALKPPFEFAIQGKAAKRIDDLFDPPTHGMHILEDLLAFGPRSRWGERPHRIIVDIRKGNPPALIRKHGLNAIRGIHAVFGAQWLVDEEIRFFEEAHRQCRSALDQFKAHDVVDVVMIHKFELPQEKMLYSPALAVREDDANPLALRNVLAL